MCALIGDLEFYDQIMGIHIIDGAQAGEKAHHHQCGGTVSSGKNHGTESRNPDYQ